ncbi:MAG: DUF4838 domain-containing protein, partial [Pedobacter sp.]
MCARCTALNNKYGSAQGSLLTFVNKIAARFPEKKIVTLAYNYTRKPPKELKPLDNVVIMLSDIEVSRTIPIAADPRSSAFRKDVEGWKALEAHLLIWDYVVQFTNYMSPFPNLMTLKPNLEYFKKMYPEGLFIQGAVETRAEFSELRTYVLAKLLWDPYMDQQRLVNEFIGAKYGRAAPYIQEYITALHENAAKSGKRTDIYDTPIVPYKSYLTSEKLQQYLAILNKAMNAVRGDQVQEQNVIAAILPVKFALLQQARFYGIEKNGVFKRNGTKFKADTQIEQLIRSFNEEIQLLGITQLNEAGLTPQQYKNEWNALLKNGPSIHKGLNKQVTLLTEPAGDFMGKGAATLTDGNKGTFDHQYNWLGWNGDKMEVILDLGKPERISSVNISFLEMHQHLMFLPQDIKIFTSADGKKYSEKATINYPVPTEGAEPNIKSFQAGFAPHNARFIKLMATPQPLPSWVILTDRKPWIMADEVIIR